MMRLINTAALFLFAALLPALLQAQATRKYSNEFLAIGIGARAMAMGKAVVASSKDVSGGYWNAAGLTEMNRDFQVGLMHSEYFAGIAKFDYAGFAMKTKSDGVLAFNYIRFGVDNIPNTIDLIDNNGNVNYDRITTFSAVDNAFLISYAMPSKIENLSIGGSAKIIYRKVGDFARAWGFGIDGAMRYKRNKWQFGAVLRDASSTFNAWSYTLSERMVEVFTLTGNEIPQNSLEITLPRLIGGVAYQWDIKKFGIMPEFNFDMTTDGQRNTLIQGKPISIDPYFGLELNYAKIVYVRGGMNNFQKIKAEVGDHKETTFQPNIGVGLSYRGFNLDYALTDLGDASAALYSNVFSLRVDINRTSK
ncbi:MAG: hypothetical protein KDC37_06125 [Flavobacteriales bacterium]|nr:hypothetical protein [Flavobacteriales bacterium]